VSVSRRRLAALLAVVVVAVAGAVAAIRYADSSPNRLLPPGGSSFAAPSRDQPHLTDITPPPPRSARETRLAPVPRLPLARGVAQLFVVGFSGSAVPRAKDWGGVLLDHGNVATLAAAVRAAARQARHLAPLVVASARLPGVPRGGRASPAGARRVALKASRKLRRAGVTAVLAPSADVGYAGGPAVATAFGDTPDVVTRALRAAVDGWRGGGVAPVVGSYPGTGGASGDPAREVATVGLSLDELRGADIKVFQALRARAPVIQMSAAQYAAFDGVTPATLLSEPVAMLRKDGFRGVIMSASLPATTLATGGSVADAAVDALRAGCDLLLVPGDAGDEAAAYRAVLSAVRRGVVPMSRYRDALARVAALKRAYRVR
jgi:beta-N-acetylhexosaminidase